jgi:hypothetical protein
VSIPSSPVVEPLDADAADDPAAQAGHGDLSRPGQLDDLVECRPGRAGGPQPVLGHRVDLVGQHGDPCHQLRVVALGRREQLDLERRRVSCVVDATSLSAATRARHPRILGTSADERYFGRRGAMMR